MGEVGTTTGAAVIPIQRGGWLDGLRIIAAVLMVLHHYAQAAPVPLGDVHPVFERGYLITNFFLIDSGYVLARIYGERTLANGVRPGDFFLRRVLRVAPAHLAMSLALVALVLAAGLAGVAPSHPEWFDWRELPAQVLLLQAYGVPGGQGWNAPSWSISALIGCYLCFPWLVRGVYRLTPWNALAGAAALYALANLLTTQFLGYPVYQMPLRFGFLRALPLFLLGVALARFAAAVPIPPKLAAVAGVSAAILLVIAQALGPNSLASLTLIAVAIIAAGAIPVRRRNRWVEQAAIVSFSVFITNEVVRIAWFGVVGVLENRFPLPPAVDWAVWSAGVAAALIFAYVFHHLIDMPVQRRLASRDDRRPSASRIRWALGGAVPATHRR